MNEKPEALRLADGLERGIQLYLESLKNGDQQMTRLSSVAAELRRLHAENERLREELRQNSIDHTRAEVERLREALEKIATVNAMDYEYVRWAKAALRREEV